MKKLIAVAAVVVVSFAAQSSVCGPVACKVTFVDVDGSQKPIMLLDDKVSTRKSSMNRVFDDVYSHGRKVQTDLKSTQLPSEPILGSRQQGSTNLNGSG
ncbi:hypothetical protein L1C72_26105 [Klebsiella pneumoniae]|uniref:hypothetical protein n=1 Tax=Klebsiella pneumoniae TaxID=573 RepID=UPI002073B8DB|nr:hypothetical protein [Klebsiella pneumoniae]MCM6431618.1 hypothetical protein [Klebsiella pneumoniae]MCM6492458.1 hypothetical protein [Klebsiella pneumoniae]MCQ0820391.1 hypothetical protein [Klebsiella pneumoniae]MDG0449910.1 hypothetical protein [Klebsiella pneumoniae]